MAMLNHLLHEDALDRLVAGAYVGVAKPMKHQERSHDRDSDNGYSSGRHFRGHRIISVGALCDERNTSDRCARGGRGDPCTQWSIPNQAQNPEDGILLSAFLRDLGFLRLLYNDTKSGHLDREVFRGAQKPNP
jgi:hypothetical protein